MKKKIKSEWVFKDVDFGIVSKLANAFRIPIPVAEVYVARGLDTIEKVNEFRSLKLSHLHDSYQMPDAVVAIDRLERAIKDGETITLWGDYDVDGITSTAVVVTAINMFGGKVDYHVPNRFTDGYDVKKKAVDIAVKNGSKLLMTVDCGIRAFETAKYAKEKGVDLLITDHHHPSSDGLIPECIACVNPNRLDSTYAFNDLAGVGIAFKLMCGLAHRLGFNIRSVIDETIEYVAMGTVADVAPMYGENRILVAHGLEALARTKKAGLKELLAVAGANPETITTETIGFQIGPRLNACGRLEDAKQALDLILERHPREAKDLAIGADNLNKKRQRLQEEMMDEARAMVPQPSPPMTVLVLAKNTWHQGIVGLLAGKMAEEFGVPCLAMMINEEGGYAKGSGRSVRSYNLLSAITAPDVHELFTACGGHSFACGFTLPIENIPLLQERLHEIAVNTMRPVEEATRFIDIDAMATAGDLTPEMHSAMRTLAPFGNGHPDPIFMTSNLEIENIELVGKSKQHLKLTLRCPDQDKVLSAVAWHKGAWASEFEVGQTVDVCYKTQVDVWKNICRITLLLEDIRLAENHQ